ncbi:MAG: Cof-type HAD-IIB family hydrolase [Candidatus Adiutrix sp.]|jgi:hydroxymethylpyrimidine pyrophosphatase-like HAD family hydrolase|nr:Cof-type HAD-IIB family hydrolase [Candidatus Adiutrix sp.]
MRKEDHLRANNGRAAQGRPRGLWLMDFDGTIKPSGGRPVSSEDGETLNRLGGDGWFRVAATGRSLFAFATAWDDGMELDGLIFSSGAAACLWGAGGPGRRLFSTVMAPKAAHRAGVGARAGGFGFFAYHAPPDSHHFHYLRPVRGKVPAGFDKRLDMFAGQSCAWPEAWFENWPPHHAVSQFLIMVPLDEIDGVEAEFERLSPGLSLIRSSSPFDDGMIWLEIFAPGVSKGSAAARLAERLGLENVRSVALGNDYNDLDLLAWADRAFVVADAAPSLLRLYPDHIAPAGGDGLKQALRALPPDFLKT